MNKPFYKPYHHVRVKFKAILRSFNIVRPFFFSDYYCFLGSMKYDLRLWNLHYAHHVPSPCHEKY